MRATVDLSIDIIFAKGPYSNLTSHIGTGNDKGCHERQTDRWRRGADSEV